MAGHIEWRGRLSILLCEEGVLILMRTQSDADISRKTIININNVKHTFSNRVYNNSPIPQTNARYYNNYSHYIPSFPHYCSHYIPRSRKAGEAKRGECERISRSPAYQPGKSSGTNFRIPAVPSLQYHTGIQGSIGSEWPEWKFSEGDGSFGSELGIVIVTLRKYYFLKNLYVGMY
jgi:hypothetical protein